MVDEYFKMKDEYERGIISADEWIIYCMTVLGKLMILHQDVLKNLKN